MTAAGRRARKEPWERGRSLERTSCHGRDAITWQTTAKVIAEDII